MNNKAQGTIEYLVIISVIIVLSLIVVALFISVSNSPAQQITDSSNKLGTSGSGISIVEAVTDLDGDSIVKLNNLSNDVINLTKISVGSTDNEYIAQLVGLDSKLFTLKSVSGDNCTCVSGQKTITCNLRIEYTIPPATNVYTLNRTITSQCVSNSTPAQGVNAVDPIDSVPPVVLLNSPEGTLDSRDVEFSFTATESNEITFCSVDLSNGSSLPVGSVASGVISTLDHSFDSDLSFDWNVSCEDDSGNIGVSSSKHIDIVTDTSPPVISLSSPEDGNVFSGRDLVFGFSSTDDSGIDSCTLNIGSDSNTYYNLNNGVNTIVYTKVGDDGEFDWSISCTDGEYSATSSSRQIIMDANALQIASCLELQDINKNLAGDYIQMKNIDCGQDTNNSSGRLWNGGLGFSPIGACGPSDDCAGSPGYTDFSYTFSGSFNGMDYTISNIYINRTTNPQSIGDPDIGLFGAVHPESNLSNIHLVGVNITGLSQTGALAGHQPYKSGLSAQGYGDISNCSSTGSVNGKSSVGGLVGVWTGNILNSSSSVFVTSSYAYGSFIGGLAGKCYGSVLNCNSTGTVTASTSSNASTVGGLLGGVATWGGDVIGDVNNSYFTGDVIGYSLVGGLAGISYGDVNYSYSTGNVTGAGYRIGGLIGSAVGGSVNNSYSNSVVTKTGSSYYSLASVGGLVGALSGSNGIYNSYATGNVYGDCNVGGLVGRAEDPIYYSYSTGDVNSFIGGNAGGLVGNVYTGSVSNSYSLGDVNAPTSTYYGGLVGNLNGISGSNGSITKSFSAGKVTAVPTNTTIGSGFLGYRGTYGVSPTYSYWDINTSKRTSSTYGGTGRTTLQMYNDGNYSTWDFVNTWDSTQNSHYPTLKWQP